MFKYYLKNRIFLLLLFFPSIGFASVEKVAVWRAVALIAELPAPYGETLLNIKTEYVADTLKISAINIKIKNCSIAVPQNVFNDIINPLLNTVEIRSEQDLIYIYFKFGEKSLAGKGDYPTIHIAIRHNKVIRRSILRQTSENLWKDERKKY